MVQAAAAAGRARRAMAHFRAAHTPSMALRRGRTTCGAAEKGQAVGMCFKKTAGWAGARCTHMRTSTGRMEHGSLIVECRHQTGTPLKQLT